MAKARKLQQEVDATLKRVQEGCDEWDALWDKLEDTADASQRDKIICELKRDLKKLQRLRETVRGWAAGGDVKDHTPLQDARRNVEREMERFKLLEKEIKTKAFSSEGLKRDMNDPLTAAKYSCGEWLNETVSRLTVQIEEMEADVERLLPDCKGKGRTKNSRVSELEAWIGRHKDHVMRLEQVLRLMENDQVAPEDVMSALKDGLEYYLDSYSDPDFMEDESLYDSLPLDEVDETVGKITAHTPRASSKRQKPDAMQEEGAGEGAGEAKSGRGGRGKGSKAASAAAAAAVAGLPGGKGKGKGAELPAGGGKLQAVRTGGSCRGSTTTTPTAGGATPNRVGSFKAAAAGGKSASPRQLHTTSAPATPSNSQQGGAQASAAGTPTSGGREMRRSCSGSSSQSVSSGGGVRGAGPPPSPRARAYQGAPQPPPAIAEEAVSHYAPPPPPPPPLPQSPRTTTTTTDTNDNVTTPSSAAPLTQPLQRPQPPAAGGQPPQEPPAVSPLSPCLQGAGPFGAPPPRAYVAGGGTTGRDAVAGFPRNLPQIHVSPSSLQSPTPPAPLIAFPPPPQSPLHGKGGGGGTSSSRGNFPEMLGSSLSPGDYRPLISGGTVGGGAASWQLPGVGMENPSCPSPFAAPGVQMGRVGSGMVGGFTLGDTVMVPGAAAEERSNGVSPSDSTPGTPCGQPSPHSPQQAQQEGWHPQPEGAWETGVADGVTFRVGSGEYYPPGNASLGDSSPPGPHHVYTLPRIPTCHEVQLLESAVRARPQPSDAQWRLTDGSLADPDARPAPDTPHPVVTPASFPNQIHPSLAAEETFQKMSTETAFFAFYFQQNPRQKLLAANRLKSECWRYHTQFNAWFARQSQPKVVTEEYEQGSLVYFDCQLHNITPNTATPTRPSFSGWCQRVSRPDFIFDYRYMENEDTSIPSG